MSLQLFAKVNLRKQQLAVGAAALLVAALSFGVIEGLRGSRELEALWQREQELDLKIKSGEATLNSAQQISQWQAASCNQLQQMMALEELMEGTDRMYLSQYAFTAGQGESVGNLQTFGNAKSREDVLQFQQRMIDSKNYSIQPRQLTQTSNDDEYAHRFEINANLLTKPAATPALPPSTLSPRPSWGTRLFLVPLRARRADVAERRERVSAKEDRVSAIELAELKMMQWQVRSFSPDAGRKSRPDALEALRQYTAWLTELVHAVGFDEVSVMPRSISRKNIYLEVVAQIDGSGRLSQLSELLDRWNMTGFAGRNGIQNHTPCRKSVTPGCGSTAGFI